MNASVHQDTKLKQELNTCYHCGDLCNTQLVHYDDKDFCCNGCQMVYSILNENNLQEYYNLNVDPGISQKNKSSSEYQFLDDPATISKLIDFADDEKTRIHFQLPQIHCSSCIWLLENLYRLNEGIHYSRVDFTKKEALILFSHKKISLRQIVELLVSIGYEPIIQLHDLDSTKAKTYDKSLFYKLGLSGFAFGNIMLLSFPEYLGVDVNEYGSFVRFLGYLNILLILPVVFYSGKDYLFSAWRGIKQNHLNIDVPISLGILALFFRSVYEILNHTGAGYLDSLAGLIFFLLIGKWFQQTTYSRMIFDRDYKSYFPIAAKVLKEGTESQVTLDRLMIGDILIIRHGELIPTDSVIKKGTANIDYSFVTGESQLIQKGVGDRVYAGGSHEGGIIELEVIKEVSNSYLTQLWNNSAFDKSEEKGEVSELANKVASWFTVFILLIAFSTLFYWLAFDSTKAINAFTAVLIIACPCAVALSIPFTFGNVIRIFARAGIFLKNIHVIESLSNINSFVFDKTGTLTNNSTQDIDYNGRELSDYEKQLVYSSAYQSTHPMSKRIINYFDNLALLEIDNFKEYEGQGIETHIGSKRVKIGSLNFLNEERNDAEQMPIVLSDDFNTNLGGVLISIDGAYAGSFYQKTNFREGLKDVLSKLERIGEISVLSGDNDKDRKGLAEYFRDSSNLHFNKKPEEKLEYIVEMQNATKRVAMIGDGLNDAGALSQSNVGIVLAENTSNFTPGSDLILDAENFSRLPEIVNFAKLSIRLVYIAYTIALIYNIVGLSFAVRGELSPVIAAILMPLSSVSIVLFGVVSSTILAHKNNFITAGINRNRVEI